MIYTRPDYFNEFKCIAGNCPDTCCAGWQIVIDDESLKKYKKIKGDYIWKVMSCVNWEEECFRQDNDKRCAFLNSDNLCDLYKNVGEESLCKTCRDYPRHTEEFEGVREVTLSASCPVVARILMERMTPVHFVKEEHPEEEETEFFGDFDPFLYSIIEDGRSAMIDILQNRNLSMKLRTMLVLGMAHDMQRRINHRELFACDQVIEKYKRVKSQQYVKDYLGQKEMLEEENLTKEMFPLIYDLELLRDEWDELLHRSQDMLFFTTQESFGQLKTEFDQWKHEHPDMEIHLEQIMVYFLYTYFPGSVYDGQLFAKAQMAVYCTWMIELLWMARWLMNGRAITLDEMTELLYRFSREIEHSDENLEKLDEMMIKKWLI
ncbi:MAG: flagellin lysine-N-methylase [Agathobacter sp.]|nr:flagellin lysine-N-methylase [Agathobacter sp.]